MNEGTLLFVSISGFPQNKTPNPFFFWVGGRKVDDDRKMNKGLYCSKDSYLSLLLHDECPFFFLLKKRIIHHVVFFITILFHHILNFYISFQMSASAQTE